MPDLREQIDHTQDQLLNCNVFLEKKKTKKERLKEFAYYVRNNENLKIMDPDQKLKRREQIRMAQRRFKAKNKRENKKNTVFIQ